jgi:peptidoglycan/xylan/chitin deacetylase (PgdA/CDA1 family)
MVSVKRALKRSVQSAVAAVAPHLWGRGDGSLLVLMYHRVLPHGNAERAAEQPGMYVAPETLAMHLELLKRHFTPIHLEEWWQRIERAEPLPRRACAVTFDDGWRDNHEFAWPVLRAAGVPATVFIVSSLVGTRYSFWPNRLARLLGEPRGASATQALLEALPELRVTGGRRVASGATLGPEDIDAAVMACKRGRSDADMTALLERLAPPARASAPDLMDWDEIRAMSADGQIRIGSHTRHHVRLAQELPAAVAEDEIVGSIAEIEAQLGMRPACFCYPNGDYAPASAALVARHFRCAVTTRRGWNDRRANRHLLARVGVHDEIAATPSAFVSRLAGVG